MRCVLLLMCIMVLTINAKEPLKFEQLTKSMKELMAGDGWVPLTEKDFTKVNSIDTTWSFKDNMISFNYCAYTIIK